MSLLTESRRDDVALITMDDGKVNALSHAMIDALQGALDRAERDARAVVLAGRAGFFCAGFDLGSMTAGLDSARALVEAGSELNLRLILHPQPVVAACTGHALAAGALLLLSADSRIGTQGKFKIGLNEVAIGLRLPVFAAELARDRLSKRHFLAAAVHARLYDPDGARDAGFLDRVEAAEAAVEAAVAAAQSLSELDMKSLAETKRILRGPMVERVRASLASDLASFDVSRVRTKR
jgi:enoyl-CoA hydratase